MEQYDKNKSGWIELEEVREMMVDTYGFMGKQFAPSQEDLREYLEVLDQDQDGRVGLEDIRAYVQRVNKI